MKIVIVEDHQDLRNVFLDYLTHEGYIVHGVASGEELNECLLDAATDLLILDVNLPGESGFDIAKRIRYTYPAINIIMLTVRADEPDRIEGYESGADLYLAKPVSAAELVAAVRSVHRRVQGLANASTVLELHAKRCVLVAENQQVSLSASDTALIKALAISPDRRQPYWKLFEATERSIDAVQSKSQLELQIFRLRKKMAEIGVADDLIKAVYGEGYRLTAPIRIVE